jgi:PAS domain S-box-containing protein
MSSPSWLPFAALRHARHSLTGKLLVVMLATTAIALLVAGAALLFLDVRDNRRSSANDLSTEGDILALAVQPALAFGDRVAAQRNLDALSAKQSITGAALFDTSGSVIAQYVQAGETPRSAQPTLPAGLTITGERIELLKPVTQGGETLGALYLRAHYDVTGRVRAYLSVLGAVMLLGLIAALFVANWLQRVVTVPLQSMADVARQIVESRDYSLRAAAGTPDELGVVIRAFNRMMDEVQSRSRELERSERLYRGIGESINYGVWVCDAEGRNTYASDSFLKLTGLTQQQCSQFGWGDVLHPDDLEDTIAAWKECVRTGSNWYREHRIRGVDGRWHYMLAQGVPIRDANGKIERWAGLNLDISRLKNTEHALLEADRRKDEFLATLAHELRNPLAPIRNAVRILDSSSADELQRKWGREVISRQVHRMALLLDDLLDVSRITRGQLELKKDYVDLKSIVSVALETARPLMDAKQHTLTVSLPPDPIRLEVDPLRLSQAIGNLLTNAAKYTDPTGRIQLRATLNAQGLSIAIKDNGIGLKPEVIPGLFTMFSQVDSAVDRAEGGLGIGLALVRGLVGLHGGSVDVRSEGPGHGSEFIVQLPRHVLAPLDAAREEPRVPEPGVEPRRDTVLIADDNRDAAESLAMVLRFAGYGVHVAYNGAEALELGARVRPRAALLDIGMPGMSGYEVARRARLEAWGRHTVLIALTGWGQEQDIAASRAAGFDEHLTKPVDPSEIERRLAILLAKPSESPSQSFPESARNA